MNESDDPIQGRSRVREGFVNLLKLLLFGFAVCLAGLLFGGVATLALESIGVRLPDSD